MDANEVAQFLTASPDRCRLLAQLRDEPGPPADVADALDVSRRSVQRNCRTFEERGWAERRDGDYQLTTAGELVLGRHADYLDELERIGTFAPLYRHLPEADHAPEPAWLDGATLVTATPGDPQAPVHHYVAALDGASVDRVLMLSPVLSRLFHDVHADLAMRGAHTELVLSADLVEQARSRNPTEFAVVVGVGVLDLYRHAEPVPLGLTVVGETVLLGAYDGDGQLAALVESTDPRLREWAVDRFARYRDAADPVEPPGSLPFLTSDG